MLLRALSKAIRNKTLYQRQHCSDRIKKDNFPEVAVLLKVVLKINNMLMSFEIRGKDIGLSFVLLLLLAIGLALTGQADLASFILRKMMLWLPPKLTGGGSGPP